MTEGEYEFRVDERKRAILEAATAVFAEHGYDGASLAQVAKECGLSQAGLLHHYPSKELLLVAVLAYRDVEAAEQIDIESIPGFLSIADGVVAMFAGQLQRPELIRLFVKITAEATNPQHPAHAWAAQRFAWTFHFYQRTVQRDIDEGRVRADVDADAVSRGVVAMMDGLQLHFLLQGDASRATELFGAYVRQLVAQISR